VRKGLEVTKNSRYSGKPLLRLLELYVLWCIGELSKQDEDRIVAMTTKLEETYKIKGAWYEIVEKVMSLPDGFKSSVVSVWEKNRILALQHREVLAPQDFAEMFVDANLGPKAKS
jgi:hypothetical protein